jgi:GTPase SAR1 family protein
MSQSRKAHLDALERRLTGAKRIALFGHRAVGKTTLLAMFYREASSGRVPGVRLAAVDSASAEYLAEKIAQIEAGEPPAGTLAETPLKLRLYHGMARFDLVVKDYQGEHVSLGTEAPIQEFFADCDAVLLCLDPEASDRPVERRRRQQEVENLLERYIETTDDATTGRPVALLVTKYDRVLNGEGAEPEPVDHLVESRYGMTRHALRVHAPHSAMFAVSSYGPAARGDGRPPAELHPIGLEGPLAWLADQLEASDREQLDWLWDLAPDDLPRLSRCVKAYEKRYPRSEFAAGFRRRLNALRWKHRKRAAVRLVAAAALVAAGLVGYDAWGYRSALAFERENPAPAVEKRWGDLLAWHPTLGWTWPGDAKRARQKLRLWQVKAAEVRVAVGTAGPDVAGQMRRLKEQAPELVAEIRHVEDAQEHARHDQAWKALRVADLVAVEHPEEHLAKLRAFLHDYPETAHKAEAVRLAKELESLVANRRDRGDRQAIDALTRAAALPNAQLRDLIERADQFLNDRPESRYRGEVEDLRADYVRRLDEGDIEKARQFSKTAPHNFASRRQKYLDYLRAHQHGGRFVGEANAALERIEVERDTYLYRQAYDHYIAHPDDVATVAGRLRAYLDANPQGRYVRDAGGFLKWWVQVSTPHEYRVTLRRGAVGPDVGKTMAGAPSLSVELWVAGVKYGPTPTIPDTRRPTWDYTFPRPIRWKYGDLVSIRLVDHDWWSASGVLTMNTARGDKLGMRMLSGTVRPSKGGKTSLTFDSDFAMPRLARPGE